MIIPPTIVVIALIILVSSPTLALIMILIRVLELEWGLLEHMVL